MKPAPSLPALFRVRGKRGAPEPLRATLRGSGVGPEFLIKILIQKIKIFMEKIKIFIQKTIKTIFK